MTKKIAIFAYIEDSNIGDPVIGETCKYLCETVCKNNNIDAEISLHALAHPQNDFVGWLKKRTKFAKPNKKRIFLYSTLLLKFHFDKKFRSYYTNIIKNADCIIFGGGTPLKWFSQHFWATSYCIINTADKYNVPIYFNATGIEGYDDRNFTSNLIKKLLKKKCIKTITTRDDIVSLNKFEPNKEHKVVGDPALFSKEFYSNNNNVVDKDNIIGINVIRSGIFNVNGFDIKEEDLVNFYYEMIKRLDKDGMKWQIFTNGVENDYKLGLRVLEKLNIQPTDEKIVPKPKTAKQLVDVCSKYKGVIAGRMHAMIISTSYDIPCVGLIFNEKIKWFSRHIGAEERFFYPKDMNNYDLIYDTFKKALEEGNTKLNTKKLKQDAYNELEKFLVKTLM